MQSPQTPGVYYERVDASAPAIALLRTDIAGFVGIATRGPLHQPLPVQSWRQFQAYFGDFTGAVIWLTPREHSSKTAASGAGSCVWRLKPRRRPR